MTARYWFRPIGTCLCGKAATGHLISFDKQKPVGPYCKKCATEKIREGQPQKDQEDDGA